VPWIPYENNEKWRVWLDNEAKVINHELIEQTNQSNDKIYSCSKLKSDGGGMNERKS
jgi:hypothetical protein